LIALGSNLGDRGGQLRQAVAELSRLPQTQLVARSAWHETAPVGGPAGQQAFLNGAALVATSLPPDQLFLEARRIELQLGRVHTERWAARSLDLDILLCDGVELQTPVLAIPHPRMAFRRFVLEPAAEAAPWIVHPESGWTVQRLLDHLDHATELIAIAMHDGGEAQEFVSRIGSQLPAQAPPIVPWSPAAHGQLKSRPKLIVAIAASAGVDAHQRRTILELPPEGPVAWIGEDPSIDPLHEAIATVQSVWPALAT
jgi:2-amino-4-hydroxy-6-hydroxymethyldihydropteridine diphosphokinase